MSKFTDSMRFVGDLDDEFYADERQRDVYNEAAAIGFQLLYYAAVLGSVVLPWVAGRTGAAIALGILIVVTLVNLATTAYAKARGVDLFAEVRWFHPRSMVVGVLTVAAFVGVAAKLAPEIYFPSDGSLSTLAGAVVGGVIGVGAVVLGVRKSRKRKARFEAEEDRLSE